MSTEKRNPRVLVVDDSVGNIQVLSEVLSQEYEVFFATSGAKALEILGEKTIDLVLLDIMMPQMDGYEVCRRIKGDERLREIPVIFVTAMGEVEDEERGFEVGAVDYITKPISPPIVRARVKTHIELKAQRDYLHRLSTLDGLTGIPNRRRFDEVLEREWLRAKRDQRALTLFLMDIDFFKKYNDHYGHMGGDDCLKQVASTVAATMHRPADLAARYGGEEFVCVLPELDAEGAQALAARLLDNIRALQIPHAASEVAPNVTISLGAVTLIPVGGLGHPAMIEKADEMLYQAKREGRNRWVFSDLGRA